VDDALVGAGSLQPMWLRICCARRNSHIIQQRFFFFFFLAKFRQLEGIFFFENFQKIRHISEKKRKKRGRIRQI